MAAVICELNRKCKDCKWYMFDGYRNENACFIREDNGLDPNKVLVVTEEIEKVLETLKRRKEGK